MPWPACMCRHGAFIDRIAVVKRHSPEQVQRGPLQPVKVLQHLPQRLFAGGQPRVRAVGQQRVVEVNNVACGGGGKEGTSLLGAQG